MPPITLTTIPGFADIPARSLNAEQVALASHIGHMAANASFGLCQLEVFVGLYHNGDTVSLPTSSFDGYTYSREELMYAWTVQSSVNANTNWISGPDSLWFAAWKVDQTTGLVSTLEAYRRSGSNYQGAQSSDGTICVFTIAQRQRTNIIIATPLTAYTDIADSAFAQDKAWTTTLAEQMNINAKFGAVSSEVLYMGEFTDSQTVGVATSPKDGYVYSHSQMNLIHCWRWTTTASAFAVPDLSRGQLGPFQCTINQSTGVVSITVQMIDNNGNLNSYHDMGRVAVFALCSRSNLISGISATANAFAELNSAFFQPGSTLRASTLSQLNKNCREAALTHEFFGPTSYANGSTIPLVTSPVDGYAYTRDEMFYIWDWEDTTNQTGTHLRLPLFLLNTASLPTISLQVWRLPPGGPALDDNNTLARVSVTVVAIRGSTHSVPASPTVTQPANSGTGIDQNAPIINLYTLAFDVGPGNQLAGSTTVPFLEHVISGQITSASFAAGLSDSVGGCRVAPAGSYSITIKKTTGGVTTSIGSIDFAASATTATFTFSSTVTFVPGDTISFFAPVTADGSGYFFTLTGTRQ
jgi:hypothetical protein